MQLCAFYTFSIINAGTNILFNPFAAFCVTGVSRGVHRKMLITCPPELRLLTSLLRCIDLGYTMLQAQRVNCSNKDSLTNSTQVRSRPCYRDTYRGYVPRSVHNTVQMHSCIYVLGIKLNSVPNVCISCIKEKSTSSFILLHMSL